jgi:hypothetical protein
MAWKITHSYIEDATWGKKAKYVKYGPRNITDDQKASLDQGTGDTFQLYDGDDELYYIGIWDGLESEDEDVAFGPLSDYGMPNAGAVRMDYYDKKKKVWCEL